MNMHVRRLFFALTLVAGSGSLIPCLAQEDPARKAAQQKTLKDIKTAMIKVELGPNTKTEGRISADLIRALLALKLSQSTKLPITSSPDNSTGIILAYVETAPSRFNVNVRILCVKLQVLQPEALIRSPAASVAEDITWQTIRFCDEDIVALPATTATLVGLSMADFVTDLIVQNPSLTASQTYPDPTALALSAPTTASAPIRNMQARWIDESCRSHSGSQGISSDSFVRAVAKDFRFGLPETEEDGILESLGDEHSGWRPLAGQEEASRLVNSGWLVIAGRRSSSKGSGLLAVVVAKPGGTGTDPVLAYWGRPGGPVGNSPRPLAEPVYELGEAMFFGRKISDD